MRLGFSSSTALFVFLSGIAMACSSRVPVGTEGSGDDELRKRKDAAAAPEPTTPPVTPTPPKVEAGSPVPPTPKTCEELPAGSCESIPGCQECPPTAICSTPCVITVVPPSCSVGTDPTTCAAMGHCKLCTPAEDCICKPKPCEEITEGICPTVPGCMLCPPTAICSTMCLSIP